jgi:hypothetical protein
MTALYLTQVRSLTLAAAATVGVFALLRLRQGRAVEGGLTLGVGVALVAGSYLWALAVGGEAVSDRFCLGRWGMMNVYFADPTLWQAPAIHVEVQLTGWLLDGGVPLLLLYTGAIAAALYFTYQATVRAGTRLRQDLATIVLCLQLMLLCLCLTGPVFNTQLGILFWATTGALYGTMTSREEQVAFADDESLHA